MDGSHWDGLGGAGDISLPGGVHSLRLPFSSPEGTMLAWANWATHTPVALSSLISFKTAGITLKGGKAKKFRVDQSREKASMATAPGSGRYATYWVNCAFSLEAKRSISGGKFNCVKAPRKGVLSKHPLGICVILARF